MTNIERHRQTNWLSLCSVLALAPLAFACEPGASADDAAGGGDAAISADADRAPEDGGADDGGPDDDAGGDDAGADGEDGGSVADAGLAPDAGGPLVWRPFSDTSPWNTRIPDDVALRPDSDALIDHLIDSHASGRLAVNIDPWSVPVYYVDSSQPLVDVETPLSNEGLDQTLRWPVPPHAIPASQTDGHLTLVDRASGRGYDFFRAVKRSDTAWDCTLCSSSDLTGDGVRPPKRSTPTWYESHGSRACGYPLIAGLITVEEMEAGRIDHALVFAYPALRRRWFTSPASTGHGRNGIITDTDGIPCGGRVQLDPSIDVDALDISESARVIARALQEYGAYVGDFSGSINLYADGSPDAQDAWSDGLLTQSETSGIDLRALRVVEWGELTADGD